MSNDNNSMDEELFSATTCGDLARVETAIEAGANLETVNTVRSLLWYGVVWCAGVVWCGVVSWRGVV